MLIMKNIKPLITLGGKIMYYLFEFRKQKLSSYREEFDRTKQELEAGKCPVFDEMRSATTTLWESLPYNIVNAIFVVGATILLDKFGISTTVSIGLAMISQSLSGAVANYLFTVVKHSLRKRFCNRIGVEFSQDSIKVIESLEYQRL
jgi:hypothetical protein